MRYASPGNSLILKRAALGPAEIAARRANFANPSDCSDGNFLRRGGSLGAVDAGTQIGTKAAGMAAGVGASSLIGTAAGTAGGMAFGAAAGSVVPIIGTAIGAVVGLLLSGVLSKSDQEVQNFDQAVSLYAQNPSLVYQISNKYLALAGLFDLTSSQIKGNIPIYKKYGRMGEKRFVTDLAMLLYNASRAGQIKVTDTPLTIMARIVQPWINSFGFGAMSDMHAGVINNLIVGMILDYVTGGQRAWVARGGDYPFASLPSFPMPAASRPVASVAPVAVVPKAAGVQAATNPGGSVYTAMPVINPITGAAMYVTDPTAVAAAAALPALAPYAGPASYPVPAPAPASASAPLFSTAGVSNLPPWSYLLVAAGVIFALAKPGMTKPKRRRS